MEVDQIGANKAHKEVLLSICIPAYNRPLWLRRALESIVREADEREKFVEIIVSDDSTKPECRQVANELLSQYEGSSRYVHNAPSLGMAKNWNSAVRLASGRYVQILHDDDFLAESSLEDVLRTLRDDSASNEINLFGVRVVDAEGKAINRQTFRKVRRLPPEMALRRVLSNSAFVRFPGMVIRRSVFGRLGYFQESLGYAADIEMWARIVSEHGLTCHPTTLANFTVHQDSLTMTMFEGGVIETIDDIFSGVRDSGKISAKSLERSRAACFHKFILGGSYRYLKWHNFARAKRTMALFNHEALQGMKMSLKWLPLRYAFGLILLPVQIKAED